MYFRKKQEEDPEFFYAIEPDEDGFVKNLFWVDGRSRRAYLEFGDVVTFNTTYNTDRNNDMPLAPFIGVNNHQHSIFFGMAVFRSESKKNFCWLFQTWLSAMYGKHPTAIITDQDPEMRDAVKIIFPKTAHRCCQWHVLSKANEHLRSHYDQRPGFHDELEAIINRSMTVADFEIAWTAMLDKYDLTSNNHLQIMYETRAQWVPAYFRDTFFAEMCTAQRSKSMNMLLELWMSSNTSIYQFVRKIESMVESIWQRENDEDIKTTNETPNLWSWYQIEIDARRKYTKNVFSIFQELLKESTLGVVIEKERDALYEVSITSHPFIHNWIPESYVIEVDRITERFSCNCKGFEFEGLLCSHVIRVLCHLGIQHLPSRYILKRWCKEANADAKRCVQERSMDFGESPALEAFRFASIYPELRELAKSACKSARTFTIFKAKMSEAKGDIM